MKNKALMAIAVAVILIGCATKTAYVSIATMELATLSANHAYLDRVFTGQIPTNSVPTVEAAFNDTQLALHAAAAIASGGSSAPIPPATLVKVSNFTNLVNSVK